MTFRLSLVLCLGALSGQGSAEEACGSEDAEEMVALQVHKANRSSLTFLLPPPCGYPVFLDSHCGVGDKSHSTLAEAKTACSADGRCTGVFEGPQDEADDNKFSLCEASRPLPGGQGTVHLRGWKDCSPEEMELAQRPFRFPKEKEGVALEQQTPNNPCGPSPAPEQPNGYLNMAHTQCYSPKITFSTLAAAIQSCTPDTSCAGVMNTGQIFQTCVAPNHNFGCGSWTVSDCATPFQSTTFWKDPNPYNDECKR